MQRQNNSVQYHEPISVFDQDQAMPHNWEQAVMKEVQQIAEQREFKRFEPNETLCAVRSESSDSFGLVKNISFGGMFVMLAGTCNKNQYARAM